MHSTFFNRPIQRAYCFELNVSLKKRHSKQIVTTWNASLPEGNIHIAANILIRYVP